MRPHLALLSLLAAILVAASPVRAGQVVVDPFNQTVETTRLKLLFDYDRPEYVRNVFFKDWNPLIDIAGDEGQAREYWGQSLRGTDSTGFVINMFLETHTWEVLEATPQAATVRITSQSPEQPPVTTLYKFVADQPWFVVERTVHFSQRPDSAGCQLYAPRVEFLNSYRALRYRDGAGQYIQRGFCFAGCVTPSWDGRWVEQLSVTNGVGFGVAQLYPDPGPAGTPLVRGFGPESWSGWVARYLPPQYRDRDATEHLLVAFTRSPGDTVHLDSLWTWYNHSAYVLDAPPTAPRADLRLAVTPNPSAGPARFAWRMSAAGRARLEVLDVSGRRVAVPFDGPLSAGEHALAWDGRGADGRRVPPGVYLARLVRSDGVATARLARLD